MSIRKQHLPLYSDYWRQIKSAARVKTKIKAWKSYLRAHSKDASTLYPAAWPDKKKLWNLAMLYINPVKIVMDLGHVLSSKG